MQIKINNTGQYQSNFHFAAFPVEVDAEIIDGWAKVHSKHLITYLLPEVPTECIPKFYILPADSFEVIKPTPPTHDNAIRVLKGLICDANPDTVQFRNIEFSIKALENAKQKGE